MKTRLLLVALLAAFGAQAQRWEQRVGLNAGPLIHSSLEANYEVATPNRRALGFVSSGYTFGIVSKRRGELDSPGFHMISLQERLTGPYAKIGGRVYLNPRSQWRLFLGVAFVAARYRFRSDGVYTILDFSSPGPDPVFAQSRTETGWTTAIAGLAGVSKQVHSRIQLDAGLQSARPFDDRESLPSPYVAFRPGIGSEWAKFPAQLILTASYRLGRP